MIKKHRNPDNVGYLLILPNYLIYVVFILIPVLQVIGFSFTKYNLLTAPQFIGIKNYLRLFSNEIFLRALRNTFIYWGGTVAPSLIVGLLLAVGLRRPFKGSGVLRSLYYLPNVISQVAVALMWLWIYDSAPSGALNSFLATLGIPRSNLLMDKNLSLFLVIIPGIWMMLGYNMVVYLAGLQGISDSYYEAASIDGASWFRQLVSITIPLLKPITFFLFIMSSIKAFQAFDQIYIMTRGGPVNSTTTVAYEIYENGFNYFKMGYASSMSVILLLIISIITLVNFRYGKERA